MKKLFFIVAGLLVTSAGSYAQQTKLPFIKNKMVVIAHRGDHTVYPENTIEAFEAAIKSGADYVEIDLRTTKDGYLVIMHDANVKRMTGESGNIKDLTYGQIMKLSIFPGGDGQGITYRVPDFISILRLCKNRINIYLDFKDADVSKTFDVIKKEGMEKQVVIYSNNEQHCKEWKRIAPEIPIITSTPKNTPNDELKVLIASNLIDIVDRFDNREQAQLLKQAGISVWMDEKPDGNCHGDLPVTCSWQFALNIGAEGIQTDHPGALIHFLKSKNMR